MPANDKEAIASQIEALPDAERNSLLARIQRGDAKGRPFGTPRNPRLATIEEFNPRVRDIVAVDLASAIVRRMHPEHPEQTEAARQRSNEDLIGFQIQDPISAVALEDGLSLTGGHHRTAEIIRRVQSGDMAADTLIRILLHD